MSRKWCVLFALYFLTSANLHAQAPKYDWLVIYYMPYDNNLSPLSTAIIDQFGSQPLGKRVSVLLQTDLAGPGGMQRYSYNRRNGKELVDNESSGAISSWEQLLGSIQPNTAKHYAIILLNHGGLVDQYGLDEYPKEEWLCLDSMAVSIRKFNERMKIEKIDLLFEQVCSRGTIENLFEFKDVAMFTLASQSLVPAPGYYYPAVFKKLNEGKISGGAELADEIVASERSDMYYSYTLIDNAKWKSWIPLFEEYSVFFRNRPALIQPDSLRTLSYWHDFYWDMESTIRAIGQNGEHGKAAEKLSTFTYHELVKKLYVNKLDNRMKNYSGLSILSPFQKNDRQIRLSIFQWGPYKDWVEAMKKRGK